jgi:hypothetical protein
MHLTTDATTAYHCTIDTDGLTEAQWDTLFTALAERFPLRHDDCGEYPEPIHCFDLSLRERDQLVAIMNAHEPRSAP